jgi:hypothetical protein
VIGARSVSVGPMGVTIDEILVADPMEAWTAAGFTVDPDGTCRAGQVRIRLDPGERDGDGDGDDGRAARRRITGWTLRGLTPGAVDGGTLDGLATGSSDSTPPEPAQHPNGARLIDHLVIVTPDHDRTVSAFERAGLQRRRTRPTDHGGTPYLQSFFRAGEVIVELVGPETPTGDGPSRFYGLAYTVDDLDATAATFGAGLGPAKAAVQPGRRIATLRHQDFGLSVATAFLSAEANAEPGAHPDAEPHAIIPNDRGAA